jgi:hypothetical protein
MEKAKPRRSALSLEESLPPMTYRDLQEALALVAIGERHAQMVPYLVSALREQAPFLNSQMILFEILRSGNCVADIGLARPSAN